MSYMEYEAVGVHGRRLRFGAVVAEFARQLWFYRDYLVQSVRRDLRTKYKRSFLGYLWTMLHPLCLMLIMSVVFSHIMRIPIRDYSIFLFAGLLPWNYFQSTSLMALGSIRANARLFGQVPLPKFIPIISLACSNLLNLVFACMPLVLMMTALGRPVPLTVFALPLVILPLFFTVIGVSLLLGTCGVFFDDTLHLSEVALQALYFLSPILYSRDLLPPELVRFLVVSPLFCQIEFFRGVFYGGELPQLSVYLVNLAGSVAVLLFGLNVFRKSEDTFLYVV